MTAKDYIGKAVTFYPASGKRTAGVVVEAKDNGRTARGDIPDLFMTIRGSTGATITVSQVEQHVQIKE